MLKCLFQSRLMQVYFPVCSTEGFVPGPLFLAGEGALAAHTRRVFPAPAHFLFFVCAPAKNHGSIYLLPALNPPTDRHHPHRQTSINRLPIMSLVSGEKTNFQFVSLPLRALLPPRRGGCEAPPFSTPSKLAPAGRTRLG